MQQLVNKNNWKEVGLFLLENISKKDCIGACIVTLSGELGAGKTTLTQEIAKLLLVEETVTSPTFAIWKKYKINNKDCNFKNLIHIDAYRIQNQEELQYLDWQQIISNKDNLVFIEWPEKIESLTDLEFISLKIEHVDDNTRKVQILL